MLLKAVKAKGERKVETFFRTGRIDVQKFPYFGDPVFDGIIMQRKAMRDFLQIAVVFLHT
jgi:hypothetical protein